MSSFNAVVRMIVQNSDGTVLAIRRSSTAPSRPLTWDIPGGMLEMGEDPWVGALRETQEETGLDIPLSAASLLDVAHKVDNQGVAWIQIAFMAQVSNPEVKLSYEHDLYQWVAPEEFLNLESSPLTHQFVETLIKGKS